MEIHILKKTCHDIDYNRWNREMSCLSMQLKIQEKNPKILFVKKQFLHFIFEQNKWNCVAELSDFNCSKSLMTNGEKCQKFTWFIIFPHFSFKQMYNPRGIFNHFLTGPQHWINTQGKRKVNVEYQSWLMEVMSAVSPLQTN